MMPPSPSPEARQCPFGTHIVARTDRHGDIDVLHLTDSLATASAEQAIRAQAEALEGLPATVMPRVHQIDRVGVSLQVTTADVRGIRLSMLLERLEAGKVSIADDALLELLGRVVRAVATFHANGRGHAHGAIAPERIVLGSQGVVLTDGLYASALEGLHWTREHLWSTFGLTLPSPAGVMRFDQAADVTELAGVGLALLLRRPLAGDEYPRAMPKLLQAATERLPSGGAVRQWLQQAFQLQPRSSFASAVDAHRTFAEIARRTAPVATLHACA
jgi:hypothetical protein